LPLQHSHALQLATLPWHHRDPFDRLLIAQAQVEGLAILSADRQLAAYDVQLQWAD
jgi:PIN domain nuclease of toxin-antitoxin system